VNLLKQAIPITVVLTLLIGGVIGMAHADELIVSYRGPQDKYLPCVVLSDSSSDISLQNKTLKRMGCNGVNIIASTKAAQFSVFVVQLSKAVCKPQSEDILLFVIRHGKEKKRLMFNITEGISTLRKALVYFPEINDVVEKRFIDRLNSMQRLDNNK
jgi:hypothetical protein